LIEVVSMIIREQLNYINYIIQIEIVINIFSLKNEIKINQYIYEKLNYSEIIFLL